MIKWLTCICISTIVNVTGFTQTHVKYYYPDSTVSSEGYLSNGKPNGIWKSYYVTGVLKSIGKWQNNKLDSTWVLYNELGQIETSIEYKNGKKNGYECLYYSKKDESEYNGNLKSKTLYVNNKKYGRAFMYHENCLISETWVYDNNKISGNKFYFTKNGKIYLTEIYKNGVITNRETVNQHSDSLRTGKWIKLHDNYQLAWEANYINGVKDGYEKYYSKNGELEQIVLYHKGSIVDGNNDNNILELIEKKYINEKNETVIGKFNNNIPVGIHNVYNKGVFEKSYLFSVDGVLLSKGKILEDGRRSGRWIDYYDDGNIYGKGIYKSNYKEGTWRYYYRNGNLKQIGAYLKGLPEGKWVWLFENGDTIKIEHYLQGKENGSFVEYNASGNVILKGNYTDGEPDGYWELTINDHIEKGKYVYGLREGKWKRYYFDGSLKYEGNYIQGNADGKHKFYYPNGNLKEERYYVSGYKEGNWKKYDKNGEPTITVTYNNNEVTRINGKKIKLENDTKVIK